MFRRAKVKITMLVCYTTSAWQNQLYTEFCVYFELNLRTEGSFFSLSLVFFTSLSRDLLLFLNTSSTQWLLWCGLSFLCFTWKSKKETIVSCSSTEAGCRSLATLACELMWLKQLLANLQYPYPHPISTQTISKSHWSWLSFCNWSMECFTSFMSTPKTNWLISSLNFLVLHNSSLCCFKMGGINLYTPSWEERARLVCVLSFYIFVIGLNLSQLYS